MAGESVTDYRAWVRDITPIHVQVRDPFTEQVRRNMEDCYCGQAVYCTRGTRRLCEGRPVTFEAKYLSGPLGGTTAAIRVPVMPQHSYTAHINDLGLLPPLPWHSNFPQYEIEEYQREHVSRDYRRMVDVVTYRWINPSENLRNENAKLRERNEVLGQQAEKLAIIKEALA